MDNPTQQEYDQYLWNKVWESISAVCKGNNWTKNAIVAELSKQTKIGISVLWRRMRKTAGDMSEMTRNRLLSYLECDFEELKKRHAEEKKRGANIASWTKELANSESLSRAFHALKALPIFGTSEAALNHSQSISFMKLLSGLISTYQEERLFSSIYLTADKDGKFGQLPMKDYFIQLSYVTQLEMTTRRSLIRSEIETGKFKLQRSIEKTLNLTKDYIINFSLRDVKNLVILGNPGVGKSTFSRWLCHMWSSAPSMMENTVPVYIELKALEFENETENPIVYYISKNYLAGESISFDALHGLLHKTSSVLCLILDGYDELPEKNKLKLSLRIREISSNAMYILTSRPYGVLNTYGLLRNQTIQLDGFDMSNINNYIDAFLNKDRVNKLKTKSELLRIIRINPTLADFAHNPLMLSFIVFIYLVDDRVEQTLKKIQTRYDLQEIVIDWMHTHNKQKIVASQDEELFSRAAKIAYAMEMDKVPERCDYVEKKIEDALYIPLSQLGIAQYHSSSYKRYHFSFNSITFQEFFAAMHIGNSITSEAYSYLLQDSYFWNLTCMVIGKLNKEENHAILNSILAACKSEIIKNQTYYSYYTYLLLISECSNRFLIENIQPEMLKDIYVAYKQNIYDDRISYSVSEFIQRFYWKISPIHKILFKNIIVDDLAQAAKHVIDKSKELDPHRYLQFIIRDLQLADDIEFAEKCCEILKKFLTNVANRKDKFSNVYDSFANLLLADHLLPILTFPKKPESFYKKLEMQVKAIDAVLCPHHLFYHAVIETRFADISDTITTLEKNILLFNKNSINKDSIVADIATCVFVLGQRNKEICKASNAKKCTPLLQDAAALVLQYIKASSQLNENKLVAGRYTFWYYMAFIDQLAQLTAIGLLEASDTVDNFTLGLDILSEPISSDIIIAIDGQLNVNFEKLLSDDSNLDIAIRLKYIFVSLMLVPKLKNKVAIYRTRIFTLINTYIERHTKEYDFGLNNKVVGSKQDPIEVIDPFVQILNSNPQSETEIIYESDKRFFVTQLLNNDRGDLRYFKMVLSDILDGNFILYDEDIWKFVMTYLDVTDTELIKCGLKIFENPSIYAYEHNIIHIRKLLEFIIDLESQHYFRRLLKEIAEYLIVIVAQTLLMIKNSTTIDDQEKTEIQIMTGKILKHPIVTRQSKDDYVNTLIAFMLQYYFTSEDKYLKGVKYMADSDQNGRLVEVLYGAFDFVKDAQLLRKFGGTSLLSEAHKYHDKMKVYYFPFEKKKFELLCRS